MSSKPGILVTSAAGKTGLPTALQLLKRGFPVRAFVRRNDQRSRRLEAAGAELFVGDQYSIADMRAAMRGMQRAYHCAPTAPNGLHFGAVFTAAAHEAGIEHVVTLSQWLSHPMHPSLFTREVWLNDELVRMLPGASHTIINVGWFADNYFMVLEPAAQLGLLTMPLGDGEVAGNAPPSNEDIGAVCAGALINPDLHAGKTYRPTGPQLLSPNQIADIFTKVLGRKVKYRNVSQDMFLKAIVAVPPVNFSEAALTQLHLYAEEYRRGTFAVCGPTSAVRDVAGREAEDFETIARRIVSQRAEAIRTFGGRLRAMRNFLKILMTPVPDLRRIEFQRGHVMIADPQFSRDSQEWLVGHGGPAGSATGNVADDSQLRPIQAVA